jgi:protein kinase-like protein/ricin-type beta-trefoil lectin protein
VTSAIILAMPAPESIGRYAVRRLLGAGGFAVVWLGYDDRLDDEVAIKVLADNFAQRLDLREKFVQEARVLRRTTSQHVVEVFDIDELPDGRPYFVMTYADGGSLADAAEPLPPGEVLRIGADAALGVADLHTAGVVHRDVKPSNVLFRTAADGSRRVLVADLGLSRELARGSRLTLTAGTPGYMAPEQATGTFDHRADVYGLGATVYFGLTGHEPPADGSPPPAPSSVRPGLPPGTDAVVARAMAKDPERRWPTARAFADALHGLTTGAPVPAPPRRRAALIAVAAVAALAATVATVAWPDSPATPTQSADRPHRTEVTEPAPADGAVPGTRSRCAVVDGVAYSECFLHVRGDTAYLLDFYSHNHVVVLWGRKGDDDQFAGSQRWQFYRQPGTGAFLLYSAFADACLTVAGQGEVGAATSVQPCDAASRNQLWHWTDDTSFVLANDFGTCLDVPNANYHMGAQPFAYDCTDGLNQRWVLTPA